VQTITTAENEPVQKKDLAFVPSYKMSAKTALLVIAIQFVALLILRFELFTTFSTHLIGGFSGDGGLYYWLSQHNARSFFSLPWFNTRAFYPYSETLAWSDNYILPSFIFSLCKALGLEAISAYNSVLVLAMLLSGICMSRFCYLLTGNIFAANFAGALFMGSSYMSSVLGHPQLQFTFFFPLVASQIFAFFQKPAIKNSLIIGLLIVAAFLTTVYYAVFLALFIGLILFGCFCLRPGHFSLSDARTFLVGVLFSCIPLIFLAAPYLDVRDTFGKRFLYEPYFFSTSLLSIFSAPHSSLLFSWTKDWAHEEAHFFLGLLPHALLIPLFIRLAEAKTLRRHGALVLCSFIAAAALSIFSNLRLAEWTTTLLTYVSFISCYLFLYRLGKLEKALGATYLTFRSLIALFMALFIAVSVISFGPLGNPALGDSALGLYRLLYEFFPGFNSIRAISRILILTTFAVSILSALSIKFLIARHKPRSYWCGLIVVFLILENLCYPLAKEPLSPRPLVFDMLKNQARANDVAIMLPFSGALKETGEFQSWKEFAKIQVSAMNWAQDIDLQLINGYSGQQTKLMKELPRELAQFPDQRSLRALRSFAGLKYIVFAPQFITGFSREDFDIRLRYLRDQLKLLQVDAQGSYLFELTGEMILDSDFQLLVPSFPPRTISMQLKGSGSGETLHVHLAHQQEKTPFASIKLEPDDVFRWYSINLPLVADSVRPLRLLFPSVNQEAKLLLGETRVKIED
jgi:hypothetical protein